MSNREFLVLEGAALQQGQTRRIICPWCMGGKSGEASMNLTRKPEGLAYNCHRASCGVRGYVDGMPVLPLLPHEHEPKSRVYTGPVLPLEDADYQFFLDRFELPYVAVQGRILRSYDGRYILPIIWRGEDRGYVLRRPWPGAPIEKPWAGIKADVYMHDQSLPQQALYNNPMLDTKSPYSNGYQYVRTVVIVEDQLSAMKVKEAGAIGVALLGANLNLEKVREIQRLRPDEVILALDPDATATSFRFAREFGMAFPKTRVAIMEKDLKDTKLADIPTALSL